MLSRVLASTALLLVLGACTPCVQGTGYSAYGGGPPSPAPAPNPTPAPGTAPAPPTTTPTVVTIDPWTIPGGNVQPFGERTVKVGDSATFKWTGLHGLFRIPNANCPQTFTNAPPLVQVMPPTNDGSATVNFDQPGDYWFACPVDGHCLAGMKIKFTAS